MDSNIISALIGVGLGWLLSQFTDLVKERRKKKKKIDSIYTELCDINGWLIRMLRQTKYALQLLVLDENVFSTPGKIHTFIFNEHFHEICMDLSRDSRIGLTDSYDSINAINQLIDQLVELINLPSDINNNKLIQKFDALHYMAYSTEFKTRYLLNHRNGNMSDLKGVAKNLDKEIEEDISSLLKEAKVLGADGVKALFYQE